MRTDEMYTKDNNVLTEGLCQPELGRVEDWHVILPLGGCALRRSRR